MTDLKLIFSQEAYHLLEDSTDHTALKKLCNFYLTQLKYYSGLNEKYSELIVKNENILKTQEHLEKELINYKLKFEEISTKLESYVETKNAMKLDLHLEQKLEKKEDITTFHSLSMPSAGYVEKIIYSKNNPTIISLESFIDSLKLDLKSYIENTFVFYLNFQKYKDDIKVFLSNICKMFKNNWLQGKEIPSIFSKNKLFQFTHILPHNKKESILQITVYADEKDKIGINYQLIPQSIIENMLQIGDNDPLKNSKFILKEIKDLIKPLIVKVGVKNYLPIEVSVIINQVKDKYLNS